MELQCCQLISVNSKPASAINETNHNIKTNICTVFSYTESIAPTYVSASRSHHQGVPSLHVLGAIDSVYENTVHMLVLILSFVIVMHGEYNVK
jgi:hypothetical protein